MSLPIYPGDRTDICPNLLDQDDPDSQPCGDEGRTCDKCSEEEAAYWFAYFGLRKGMSRQERIDQLNQFAPPGREISDE